MCAHCMTLVNMQDGMIWEIEEVRPDLHVKISRERTELEAIAERNAGKKWGYCTPFIFHSIFGIPVSSLLEAWL